MHRPELRSVVVQNVPVVQAKDLLQKELASKLNKLEKANNSFEDAQHVEDILEAEIRKLIKSDTNVPIEKTVGFMELGLDSFGMFNLSNQINRVFGQNLVNIIHLFEHSTVELLGAFIQQNLLNCNSGIVQHANSQSAQNPTSSSNRQQEAQQTKKEENPAKEEAQTHETPSTLPAKTKKAAVSFCKPMKKPNLVFLFAGHGSLYSGVCADLCAKVSFVEQQVTICSQHFQEYLKLSIVNIIKQSKTDEIKSLLVEHAVIFTIGYSLAKFWMNVNLEPTHLIGHSLGAFLEQFAKSIKFKA